MPSTKPTVSVGITAYNEEHAFPAIFSTILSQVQDTFTLEKIMVISDGSTDNTVKQLKNTTDKKVVIKEHAERKGKASRLNELCTLATSDILVLLDADINIQDTKLLEKLVAPFISDKTLQGVSGSIQPNKPQNMVQKIVYTGTQIWDKTRESATPNDVYYCTGAIRALRKSLYQTMTFPNIAAEDVYPYLYCASKNLSFKIIPDAIVYYNLPATYTDYLKQMKRYLTSKTTHEHVFDKKLIEKTYSITPKVKLHALVKQIIANPFWTLLYILFLVPAHLQSKTSEKNSVWDMVTSSKQKGDYHV